MEARFCFLIDRSNALLHIGLLTVIASLGALTSIQLGKPYEIEKAIRILTDNDRRPPSSEDSPPWGEGPPPWFKEPYGADT